MVQCHFLVMMVKQSPTKIYKVWNAYKLIDPLKHYQFTNKAKLVSNDAFI